VQQARNCLLRNGTREALKRLSSAATSRKMMTTIEYKGFRIEVSPVGKGWRASVFPAGSNRALGDSPSNLEKSRTDEIVAEAKRIIDARLGPRSV
jgi:hypothetical protein